MITVDEISPRFASLLSHSGWTPDRVVDISAWLSRLEFEGFRVTPNAIAILESLGGLSVAIPPRGTNPYEYELQFDPVTAATGEYDRAVAWIKKLGVGLFPLGEEVGNGNILWSGSDGHIYFGRGFGLYLLGETFHASMDKIAFSDSPLTLCVE